MESLRIQVTISRENFYLMVVDELVAIGGVT